MLPLFAYALLFTPLFKFNPLRPSSFVLCPLSFALRLLDDHLNISGKRQGDNISIHTMRYISFLSGNRCFAVAYNVFACLCANHLHYTTTTPWMMLKATVC